MTRQPSRGFTLIELLVVIIIMAVMAGVAVPAYSRLAATTRFDGVVTDVQDLFAYAREQAVSKDTIVTVTYSAQADAFVVTSVSTGPTTDLPAAETGGAKGETANLSMSAGAPMRTVQLPPGYSVNFSAEADMTDPSQSIGQNPGASPNSARFHGDGTSDVADLKLASIDGTIALHLSPATGRLKPVDAGGR
jgi:prepilin-type N-terminal cleavage/methylation domain-containing protein